MVQSDVKLVAAVATMLGWQDVRMQFVRGFGCPDMDMLFGLSPSNGFREPVPDFVGDANAWLELLQTVRGDTEPPMNVKIISGDHGVTVTLTDSQKSVSSCEIVIGEAVCRVCLAVRGHDPYPL